MGTHKWSETIAHQLFSGAVHIGEKCYATKNGIAFEGKDTADGSWHGYPIPWESAPAALRKQWLTAKVVTAPQIRRTFSADRNEIGWAHEMDFS